MIFDCLLMIFDCLLMIFYCFRRYPGGAGLLRVPAEGQSVLRRGRRRPLSKDVKTQV